MRITLDGRELDVQEGNILASVLMSSETNCFRRSVAGEPRGPLCGMGICHECRVTIDGHSHQRACMILVRDGMRVETG